MLERIEALVQRLEACPDPPTREAARMLVQALLDFHRAALGRVVEIQGGGFLERMAKDPEVAPLLLLYDLHPEGLGRRVEGALEKVRPYLHSHGGNVELLGVEEGRVRLRLQGSCQGCPSSAETLKGAVEQAILSAAPDVAGIEVV